ncbi:MAG: LVIVD repeat protein [Methanoregula sp. PtaU1.Bin051]|nr:MAG: LVIVD repeat protein [Methanoregula sp. PtaU1.Bin051]
MAGNYAYVVSEVSDALEIVDVSDPANPSHKGSIIDGAGGALLDSPQSAFVSGNYAYVASYSSDALEIVNVGNIPATGVTVVTPTKITGTFDLTDKITGLYNVVVTNPRGFFAVLSGGFSVYYPSMDPPPDNGGEENGPRPKQAPGTPQTVSVNVGQAGHTSIIHAEVTGIGVGDIIVTAKEASGPGNGVPPPPGLVYEYAEITPARFTGITKVSIRFFVPQSWLDEHQLTPGNIVLYHNVGDGWQALPTTFDAVRNGLAYFTATGSGFSRFAITGQAGISPEDPGNATPAGTILPDYDPAHAAGTEVPTTAGTIIPAAQVTSMTTALPAGKPADGGLSALHLMIAVGAGLLFISGGILVRRWWIRRQNPALFREDN